MFINNFALGLLLINNNSSPMKPPILLKTILDISFFLLLLTFCSALGVTAMTAAFGQGFIPIEIDGQVISELSPVALVVIFAELVIGGLSVYTIYVLRKLVRSFFKGKFFTRYQIASLNLIGQLIIVVTLGQAVIGVFARIYFESRVQVGVQADLSFTSFWFILAIGLFFMYLSKIFENARLLKEENELTV